MSRLYHMFIESKEYAMYLPWKVMLSLFWPYHNNVFLHSSYFPSEEYILQWGADQMAHLHVYETK